MATYDFVFSYHTIEHTAHPLRALQELARILRENGTIVLVVPHKDETFDHRRPVTPLAHLIEDHEREVGSSGRKLRGVRGALGEKRREQVPYHYDFDTELTLEDVGPR